VITARRLPEAIPGQKRTEDTPYNRADECRDPERQEVSIGAKEKLGDTAAHDAARHSAECTPK